MSTHHSAPSVSFADLNPELVFSALEAANLMPDGRLTALNSFENRVYLAGVDSPAPEFTPEQVVVKFYRPKRWNAAQIDEELAFTLELHEAEIAVAPPWVLQGQLRQHFKGFHWAATAKKGGRRPESDDWDALITIGRLLGRLHQVGARQTFTHRPALSLETHGTASVAWLETHGHLPLDVRQTWLELAHRVLERLEKCAWNASTPIRIHGDCHAGNVLWTPDGEGSGWAHVVDFDDACNGPAMQDLWMLLSGERAEQTAQLDALKEGYEQVRPFPLQELVLMEPLRTLRILRYAAWLAQRWQDPSFQANFPWFGTSDYWKGQCQVLEDQLEALDAPLLHLV